MAEPSSARFARMGFAGAAGSWVLAGLGTAASLAIQLTQLGHVSLWGDEVFSVALVAQPWSVFAHYLWGKHSSMTLYYLLLREWLGLVAKLGLLPTELLVRLPSVLLAALSVGIVFLIGERFWSRTVGSVGAGVYLLNYLQLTEAGQARAYGMELFLISVAWYALLAAIAAERYQRHWLAGYVAAATLGLYAHLFSLLVILSQVVALGVLLAVPGPWRDRVQRARRPISLAVGALGLLAIPILVDAAIHGENNAWVPAVTPRSLIHLLGSLSGRGAPYIVLIAGACAAALLLPWLRRRSGPTGEQAAAGGPTLALLAWLAVPVFISYAATQPALNLHLFFDRYLVVVVPPLCLLAGVGVSVLRPRAVQIAVALILLLVALPAVPRYDADVQRQDFRTAYQWIGSQYQRQDGLVCVVVACSLAMDYYQRAYPGSVDFGTDYPGERSWTGGYATPVDPGSLALYAQRHPRIFFVRAAVTLDFPSVPLQERAVQDWLDEHDQLLADTVAPGAYGSVEVRLYATAAQDPTPATS